MAFTPIKIANRTSGAPGMGAHDRSEDMDFFIDRGQEVQFFIVTTTAGTNTGTITTDFEMVRGGCGWKTSDGSFSTVIDAKPNASDPTQIDISGIPVDGEYLVMIFGYKIPAQVT